MEKRLMKLEDIVLDKKWYPRNDVWWQTVYQYAQAMKAGAKFPPVKVGLFEGKHYLVDGWHRHGAKKMNKEEYIEAEIKKYDNERDLYADGVKYNTVHGKQLAGQEISRIIDRLKEYGMERAEISEIVMVPVDRLSRFEARKVTNTITGEVTYSKSMVSKTLPNSPAAMSADSGSMETAQEHLGGQKTQLMLLNQVISLLENNLLDTGNINVAEKVQRLRELLEAFPEVPSAVKADANGEPQEPKGKKTKNRGE